MKRRIEMDEVVFYQDEKKGKTVAVISGVACDAFIDFTGDTSLYYNEALPFRVPEEFLIPNEVKAISTCHSTDQWDAEVGKKQAFFKLLRTYNKMKSRAIDRAIKSVSIQMNDLTTLQNQYKNDVNHYDKLVRYPRTKEE